MSITIKYSCCKCGINKRDLEVPARSEGEDVVHWAEGLGEHMAKDHAAISPFCRVDEFSDVMIPLDNRNQIGGEIIN